MRFPVPSFELTASSPRSCRTRPRARTPGPAPSSPGLASSARVSGVPTPQCPARCPRARSFLARPEQSPRPPHPHPIRPGSSSAGWGPLGGGGALSVGNYSLSQRRKAAPGFLPSAPALSLRSWSRPPRGAPGDLGSAAPSSALGDSVGLRATFIPAGVPADPGLPSSTPHHR